MNLDLKRFLSNIFETCEILIRTQQPVKEYISSVRRPAERRRRFLRFQRHFKPAINLFIFKAGELKELIRMKVMGRPLIMASMSVGVNFSHHKKAL